MIGLLFLAALNAFSAPTKTSWMSPEAFHLSVGMRRSRAVAVLEGGGWKPRAGKAPNHLIVDYGEQRSITMEFERDHLRSIRFELFDFIPAVKSAFAEEAAELKSRYGPAHKKAASILIYEKRRPNIMVVMSTDARTTAGKEGLGFLTVRYFEPPPPTVE
jgi:hypothetical protein